MSHNTEAAVPVASSSDPCLPALQEAERQAGQACNHYRVLTGAYRRANLATLLAKFQPPEGHAAVTLLNGQIAEVTRYDRYYTHLRLVLPRPIGYGLDLTDLDIGHMYVSNRTGKIAGIGPLDNLQGFAEGVQVLPRSS